MDLAYDEAMKLRVKQLKTIRNLEPWQVKVTLKFNQR